MSDTNEPALPADDSDVKRMSFEEALAELERIVSQLERGEKLKSHCDRLLSAAEDKVEKIKLNRAGKPTGTEPLDPA